MSIKKSSSTLAIIGKGSSGHDTTPFQKAVSKDLDIWRINTGSGFDWSTKTGYQYYTDLHEPRHFPPESFSSLKNEIRAIPMNNENIITREMVDISGLVAYYNVMFLPNTLCILLAKAALMGYKTIVLPGCDTMAFEDDPVEQEAGFAFWLGYVKEHGIKVITSTMVGRNRTDLNQLAFSYGKQLSLLKGGRRSLDMITFLENHEKIYK